MRLKIPEHCPQKQKKHNKIDSQKYTHISMLTTLDNKDEVKLEKKVNLSSSYPKTKLKQKNKRQKGL